MVTFTTFNAVPFVLLSVFAAPVTGSVLLVVTLSAVPPVTVTAMLEIVVVPMAEPLMPLPAELVMMSW